MLCPYIPAPYVELSNIDPENELNVADPVTDKSLDGTDSNVYEPASLDDNDEEYSI